MAKRVELGVSGDYMFVPLTFSTFLFKRIAVVASIVRQLDMQ